MNLLNCYRQFFEETHQGNLILTPKGRILHANNSALALLECNNLNELLAQNEAWLFSLFHEQKKIQKLKVELKKQQKASTSCITLTTPRNNRRCISLEMLALTCDECEYYFYTFQDRTKHEDEKNAYYNACMRDHRTGAYNERFFETELNNYHCHVQGKSTGYAIITIDIDNFKSLNDRFGHPTADDVIADFVRRVSAITRKADTFARTGGDEFSILMKEVTNAADTDRLITKLFSAIDHPFETNKGDIPLTISVGVAIYPHHGASPEEVIDHADMAMFRSKELKGNTFSVAVPDSVTS